MFSSFYYTLRCTRNLVLHNPFSFKYMVLRSNKNTANIQYDNNVITVCKNLSNLFHIPADEEGLQHLTSIKFSAVTKEVAL